MGDLAAGGPGDRGREGADGSGLVHHDEDGAELGLQALEDVPQLRFGVGQLFFEDLLAGRSQPVPAMGALADVQDEEDAYLVAVVQAVLPNG